MADMMLSDLWETAQSELSIAVHTSTEHRGVRDLHYSRPSVIFLRLGYAS